VYCIVFRVLVISTLALPKLIDVLSA
jgi:hypothetical protein